MAHALHQDEGNVRDVPFLQNDMKDHVATMDRPLDAADAPGRADSEIVEDGPLPVPGQRSD
jgi:hypothetical protein